MGILHSIKTPFKSEVHTQWWKVESFSSKISKTRMLPLFTFIQHSIENPSQRNLARKERKFIPNQKGSSKTHYLLIIYCVLKFKDFTITLLKWSEVAQLCMILCDPRKVAYQVPPSMGFSRQEYWSGVPCPSPGDLPDPGIEFGSPAL